VTMTDASEVTAGTTTARRDRPRDRRLGRRGRRRAVIAVIALVALLATPVPWRHHLGDDPLGLAWRLDGRLTVDGERVDPPGRWTFLTVGRPPLVAEVLYEAVRPGPGESLDMRASPTTYEPGLVEPAAAAVGMRMAGLDVAIGLRVEVSQPIEPGFPTHGHLVAVDGRALTGRDAWETATRPREGPILFQFASGEVYEYPGPTLPYERVKVVDIPPDGLQAMMFGWLPDVRIVRWARSLASGPSHGLMVALTTYAHVADVDLAQGRHIAGTGGIRGDGMVTPIGGLRSKARAAKRVGADVLIDPADQGHQLAGFDAGEMRLIPVRSLRDAIEGLGHVAELLPVPPPEEEPVLAEVDAEEAVPDTDADRANAEVPEAAPQEPVEPAA
jgi:hypothetical protein